MDHHHHMGDFNMVEACRDKSSLCGRIIGGRERILFNALKDALRLAEPARADNSLLYTWDNGRANGTRVFARLDRCNAFQPTADQSISNYRINGDGSLSDHCPISIQLQLCPELPRPSRWIMSPFYIKSLQPQLHTLWTSQPAQAPFFTKFRQLVRFYRTHCKEQAPVRAVEETLARSDLNVALAELH